MEGVELFVRIAIVVVTMTIYYLAVGFKTTFTKVLGFILLLIILLNLTLSNMETTNSLDMQESVMELIESNAKAFLPFGVALAALVIASGRQENILKRKDFLIQLLVATACFTYVLVIIWIPTSNSVVTQVMRETKTAVLALGGAMVVSLVGSFVMDHLEGGNV